VVGGFRCRFTAPLRASEPRRGDSVPYPRGTNRTFSDRHWTRDGAIGRLERTEDTDIRDHVVHWRRQESGTRPHCSSDPIVGTGAWIRQATSPRFDQNKAPDIESFSSPLAILSSLGATI
jgi:hypothetical protein